MATPLIPQEIYLLERYCSLEYYAEMLNAWAKMVAVAEEALRQFTLNLPPDLRSRPLYEQYDIVWGERVLPNFRSTLASVEAGYIMLKSGDLSALGFGGNVKSAVRGSMEYLDDWMPAEMSAEFNRWQDEASYRASNLSITEMAQWDRNDLATDYNKARGPLNPPKSWPQYRLNPKVTVKTGDTVTQSGIYLPACDNSCAALLIKGYECYEAEVSDYSAPKPVRTRADTTWTLVERIADSGGGTPSNFDAIDSAVHLRIEGGQACTQTGWYFTPAKANSRRYVNAGTVMPIFDTDYGSTIWQWDINQEPPKI